MKKFTILAILCLVVIGSSIVVYSQSANTNSTENSGISISNAKDNVKNFIGKQNVDIQDGVKKSYPTRDMYVLTAGSDTFYVNTRTGEVQYARYEKSALNSDKVAFDMVNAEKIANKYASAKYADFQKKNMRLVSSELLDHGDAGKEYVFTWNEQINNVYTLNTVQISVNPNTGEIISYRGNHQPVNVDLSPVISKENAIEIAKLQAKDIAPQKMAAELCVMDVDGNIQKLVWDVAIKGSWEDSSPAYVAMIVDAKSGEVIPLS